MPTTILAVDDSATMRKVLEITFAGTEFRLVTCDSPSAALEKVKTESPALVLVDVSLPPSDGYELLSTIKLASPGLPVLMLSSRHHPFDAGKGEQAEAHIDKPFDTQALQDRVRELVAGAGEHAPAPAAAAAVRPPVAAAAKSVQEPAAAAQRGGAGAAGPGPTPRAALGAPGARHAPTPGAVTTRMGPFAPPAGGAAAASASFKDTMPMPGRAVQDAAAAARANVAATKPAAGPLGGPGRPFGMGPGAVAAGRSSPGRPAADAAPGAEEPASKGRTPTGTLPGVSLGATAGATRARDAAAARPGADFRRSTVSSWPAPAPAGRDAPSVDVVVPTTPRISKDVVAAAAADAGLADKLGGMGLSPEQIEGVLALSREVVEKVVWEVVPVLAETIIKEEIARLTSA